MKRIGIFQYQWPVQVHTINLAIRLAENEFQVDLYLYGCDTSFVSLSELASYPNVSVLNAANRSLISRILGRIIRVSRRMLRLSNPKPPSMAELVTKTLKDIGTKKYDHFIGIEKNGLIWAGMLAERLDVPFLYYSLELYIDGHPELGSFTNSDVVVEQERKYHARAAGTIIQDELRAKALFESNGVKEKNAIYIPVSLTGKKIEDKSCFLHEKLGIGSSKKIILYIGQVRKKRGVNELMQCASRLGEDFVMVFHGPILHDVSTEDSFGGKVFFSKDIISVREIPKIVSSAYIGVAFYGDATVNDKLTAFSSEKIAYYMQCGLPVVAHQNESYELLMKQHRCGELIEHIHQLPEAVKKIDANYAHYRENAFAAFDHFYSFDTNVHKLVEYLSRMD